MKYLAEIMEDKQSLLFKENKVLFAFNNEQFKKSGIKFSDPCGWENYKKKIYNKTKGIK